MNIIINRKESNNLYTEGELIVNGQHICATVEHTFTMPQIGEYIIILANGRKRRRVIQMRNSNISPHKGGAGGGLPIIAAGNSWKDALKDNSIVIGEAFFPGAVKKSSEIYDRLFDRLEKCQQRKELITLTIKDDQCRMSDPIAHWLTPSTIESGVNCYPVTR